MNVGKNKLSNITNRPGSPKKTIFLSQRVSGKRFNYLEPEKSKNTHIEVNGRMTRKYLHTYTPVKSPIPYRDNTPTNISSRNIRLFKMPDSNRTLNYSLQPEPRYYRLRTPTRKKTNDSFSGTDGSLASLFVKTETSIQNGGRRHNPLTYKSFTFDSLSEQLFNDKLDKGQSNKNLFSKKTLEKYKQPDLIIKSSRANIINNDGKGWKNGYWDLSKPNKLKESNGRMHVLNSNKSEQVSAVLGFNTSTSTESSSNSSIYVPIALRGGGKKTFFNLGYNKTNLTEVLNQGYDTRGYKRTMMK